MKQFNFHIDRILKVSTIFPKQFWSYYFLVYPAVCCFWETKSIERRSQSARWCSAGIFRRETKNRSKPGSQGGPPIIPEPSGINPSVDQWTKRTQNCNWTVEVIPSFQSFPSIWSSALKERREDACKEAHAPFLFIFSPQNKLINQSKQTNWLIKTWKVKTESIIRKDWKWEDAAFTSWPVRSRQTFPRIETWRWSFCLRGHQRGLQRLWRVLPEDHPLQLSRLVMFHYR